MGFELCEGHLDGIEVGRVRRQEKEPGAFVFQALAGLGALMAGEVVEHDDIAGVEGWCQLGLYVALESEPVDWSVKQPGGCQTITSETGNEGLGVPVAERRCCPQALAAGPAATQADHLGGGRGLVEKDQAMRLKPHTGLAMSPPEMALTLDVSAFALVGQQRFFYMSDPAGAKSAKASPDEWSCHARPPKLPQIPAW